VWPGHGFPCPGWWQMRARRTAVCMNWQTARQ
jgi:hypothetical protein